MCLLASAVIVAVLGMLPRASAQVLLQDNFDSYASQAAFNVAWPAGSGFTTGTLSSAQANSPTQSILDSGTVTMRNDRALSSAYTPVVGAPLQFKFAFFDSNGSAAAYRQVSQLISGAGTASGQLISLGLSNNIASTLYMARVLGFDGGTGSGAFFQLAGTPTRTTGWHLLEADVSTDGTNNSIKFFVDGVLSTTVATGFTLRAYDTVRLGSGLTATQPAAFDDVLVQVAPVPEPTSLCLIGVAGLGLIRRLCRRPK
jgi:hypothetical protein